NRIWFDNNGNGIQDTGEQGVAGVVVELRDNNGLGNVLQTTTTDANGNYLFDNLNPGDYHIDIQESTLPSGYQFTTPNVGGNDEVDSDVFQSANISLNWGIMANTTLSAGEVDLSWDAGLVRKAHLGDLVWEDKNANGVQDAGEAGIAGVTVQLKNASGTVVSTTTTDTNGNYGFDVLPGTYSVQVTAPAGYLVSNKDQGGNDATDSDINASGATGSYTLNSGDINNTVDAGLYRTAQLGDRVWLDTNANGQQDAGEVGKAGVTVNLLNSTGTVVSTQTTDANGNYLFTGLNPGTYSVQFVAPTGYKLTGKNQGADASDSDADTVTGKTGTYTLSSGDSNLTVDAGLVAQKAHIGDFVWEDRDYNGVQGSSESGIAGVTVKLLSSTGSVLQTTTTDASGKYGFDVDAGSYQVQVVKPSGYYVTKQNIGSNDSIDSDISSADGKSQLLTVAAGETNLTLDAGLYRKASVGDKVWEDWDHNNVQNSYEGGIGGITVRLLSTTGTVLATTKTDFYGNYKFTNLDPGKYVLQFDKTNVSFSNSHWGGTWNMSDWKWAVKDAGSYDAYDSDVAGDAISKTNVSNTDAFWLLSGQYDNTRDAGITPIVIDLNGDGIHTVSRADSAGSFDLFGNGKAIESGWLAGDDGFLAIDNNGNGLIDDISELFGGLSKGDGFAKLASFDSNGDGLVDANDSAFSSLKIWQDANGNHQTDDGELLSLTDAGVASLQVSFAELPVIDEQGNLLLERSTATLANGNTTEMTDVYFNVSAADAGQAINFSELFDGADWQAPVIEEVGVAAVEPVLFG
ncbi:MAG: SdrD B-like domain-containing protein, partial [Methylomonas sp.]|nr:SdrD B-like domain-containing protein [Methylomonas sp.]